MFGRNPQQRNDEKVLYNSGEKNPFSRKRLQKNQAEGGAAICRDWLVGEGKEEWKTKEDNSDTVGFLSINSYLSTSGHSDCCDFFLLILEISL